MTEPVADHAVQRNERLRAPGPGAAAPARAREAAPAALELTFTHVFDAYAGYVLGVLRRLGVAAADVEDVAQEVFIAIHTKLPGFEGRSSLKTWVCGICLRRASEYRRKAHRRRETALTAAFEPAASARTEGELEQREQLARLERALSQLSPAQREVFVLYELEELQMVEVAALVGCPRFTAYTRLRSARRALQAAFARGAEQEAP